MISAKKDLKLDVLTVIFYGNTSFSMKEGIRAVGAENIIKDIQPLK